MAKFYLSFYKEKIEIDENSVNEELKEILENQKNFKEYNISEIEIATNENNNIEQIISDLKIRLIMKGLKPQL